MAEDDPNIRVMLDDVDQEREQLLPAIDRVISLALVSDTATGMALATEAQLELWPMATALIDDLAGLATAEQEELAAQSVDANRDANTSLWLMIGFGTTGFLTAILVLAVLTGSVLRPLASLQRSVQAVMSGNLRSRASVSGPQEVASLAYDFNR